MIKLPTQKSEPTKKWEDQKFLRLGAGKTGKSHFWSFGDKTLFIETEPGLGHLKVMKVPVRCFEDFREVFGELYKAEAAGKLPYDTIIIDTVDKLVDITNEAVIGMARKKYSKSIDKGLEINTIGDVPEGNGWAWATGLFHNAITKITELPAAIVLISHITSKKIKDGIREYDKDTISIGGQTGTKLLHWADHTLHLRTSMKGDQIRRIIRARPTESMEAGSRGDIVPDGFELNGDMASCYKRLRQLFE